MVDQLPNRGREAEMLQEMGLQSMEDLFSDIPADVRFNGELPLRGNILQGALPVKMFDAAAQGVPSLVNDDCLMGDVAQTEGLGVAAPWGDEEAVGKALLELKDRVVELTASGERERQRWLDAMDEIFAMIQ